MDGILYCRRRLTWLANTAGDFVEARKQLTACQRICEETGDTINSLACQVNLATVLIVSGESSKAKKIFLDLIPRIRSQVGALLH